MKECRTDSSVSESRFSHVLFEIGSSSFKQLIATSLGRSSWSSEELAETRGLNFNQIFIKFFLLFYFFFFSGEDVLGVLDSTNLQFSSTDDNAVVVSDGSVNFL